LGRWVEVEPRGSGVPLFHLFAQNISLNKLIYFGLGPNTSDTAQSYFGKRETILGTNAVWPLWKKFNVSLYGEANGRFVDIRSSANQTSPSKERLYTAATAPGLNTQPAFAQFGEGIRIRPELAGGVRPAELFRDAAAIRRARQHRRLVQEIHRGSVASVPALQEDQIAAIEGFQRA